jgi:hypothetical protein
VITGYIVQFNSISKKVVPPVAAVLLDACILEFSIFMLALSMIRLDTLKLSIYWIALTLKHDTTGDTQA